MQAENKKNSPSTFPKGFDPRIDLATFFRPPGLVFGSYFTYYDPISCPRKLKPRAKIEVFAFQVFTQKLWLFPWWVTKQRSIKENTHFLLFFGMKWVPSRWNQKLKSKKWSQNLDWRHCYRVIVVLSHFLCQQAKRPRGQVKTVPDVKKIAAKSFFGSIPCQKVEGVFFLFSACTLIYI